MPNDEWMTPDWVLEPIYEFYNGTIDLDPFSSPEANERVRAARFYTKEDNGYDHAWDGKIFANPPYSKPNLDMVATKIIAETRYAISKDREICLLVPAYTSSKWFQKLVIWANGVLFYNKRISFVGSKKGSPLYPNVLMYFGERKEEFFTKFKEFGWVYLHYLYPF